MKHFTIFIAGLCAFVTAYAQPPVAPSGLTAHYDHVLNVLKLRWSHLGADSFHVWTATSPEGPFDLLDATTTTQYVDSVLSNPHFYEVTALLEGQESEPCSNRVGYVRIFVVNGGSTAFGLPFKFCDIGENGIPVYGTLSNRPSDILGDQLLCGTALTGDKVLKQGFGNWAYRDVDSGCQWKGTLERGLGMTAGSPYWIVNNHQSRWIVLAGEVDNTGNYTVVRIPDDAHVNYSWRDSRVLSRDSLNLLVSGFMGGPRVTQSDLVIDQENGLIFWRRTIDNTWQPPTSALTVKPGFAYWIYNRHHDNGEWFYNYDASGTP